MTERKTRSSNVCVNKGVDLQFTFQGCHFHQHILKAYLHKISENIVFNLELNLVRDSALRLKLQRCWGIIIPSVCLSVCLYGYNKDSSIHQTKYRNITKWFFLLIYSENVCSRAWMHISTPSIRLMKHQSVHCESGWKGQKGCIKCFQRLFLFLKIGIIC